MDTRDLTKSNFSITLVSDQSPEKVFQAIINVRAWWSGYFGEEFSGNTEKLHDEFSFRAGDGAHYTRQKLIEVIPNQKVVWLITESALTFVDHQEEWTGSKVIFEISNVADKTHLVFTHQGLTPEAECYDACAPAWTQYLQHKLLPMINTSSTANPSYNERK